MKPFNPKPRPCGHCQQLYVPAKPLQSVCSPRCAARKVKAEAAEERAKVKTQREKLKTRAQWLKEAQAAVNKYVRYRDHGLPCVSCGGMPERKFGGTMDCGHYRSVGSSPGTRFDLRNLAAQCVRCNRHLGGNAVEFRRGLIERRGLAVVEELEADNKVKKFTTDYLQRLKWIFTKKARRMAKRKGLE